MTRAPEVSVIMPNFNGARFLGDSVGSVVRQSLPDWELILVDDASSDDSLAVARALVAADARIRVIAREKRGGPSAARNQAIDAARGRWIAILDSDDLMRPERLARLVSHAGADGASVIADNLLLFSERAPEGRPFLGPRRLPRPLWIDLAAFIGANTLYSRLPDLGYLKPLIRTEIIRDAGLRYDEGLAIGEDYDLMARLLAGGLRLRLLPETLYLYRRHSVSTSHRVATEDLVAQIDADARLAHDHALPAPALRALARRRRSLVSRLRHEEIALALKSGQVGHAVGRLCAEPRAWPLAAAALASRLARLLEPSRSPAR